MRQEDIRYELEVRFEEWWEAEMESYYFERPYGEVLATKRHIQTAWNNGAYVANEIRDEMGE